MQWPKKKKKGFASRIKNRSEKYNSLFLSLFSRTTICRSPSRSFLFGAMCGDPFLGSEVNSNSAMVITIERRKKKGMQLENK